MRASAVGQSLWKATKSTRGVTHDKQIENFFASLEAGMPLDVPRDEAIIILEIICATYQSATEGKTTTSN